MKTLTNAEFVAALESGAARWPPFQLGAWVYAQISIPNGWEVIRTAVPP